MNVNHEFPKRFITSGDVDGAKKPVVLRITSAVVELIGSGSAAQRKLVLGFAGTKKVLALSSYNRNTLIYLLGEETDDWLGSAVELACVGDTYAGKAVRSVRVVSAYDPRRAVGDQRVDVTAPKPERLAGVLGLVGDQPGQANGPPVDDGQDPIERYIL